MSNNKPYVKQPGRNTHVLINPGNQYDTAVMAISKLYEELYTCKSSKRAREINHDIREWTKFKSFVKRLETWQ